MTGSDCAALLAADEPGIPYIPAKVDLGRALFFDPRLSGGGAIACATCHDPARRWADGAAATSRGHHGRPLKRNTPSVLNAGLSGPQFWDGRAGGRTHSRAAVPISGPTPARPGAGAPARAHAPPRANRR